MAHHLELDTDQLRRDPLVLIIPGLNNSGENHWQTRWEALVPQARRVDLGMWDDPHRNTWVNKINIAIHRAQAPVILVAHSLGCHAVAWWAEYEAPAQGNPVVGALLVAPPDVERPGADLRLARFAPVPRRPLPFRTFLAASQNDPYAAIGKAREFAQDWGATFAHAGSIGHINANSSIGDWDFGLMLLAQIMRDHRRSLGLGEDAGVLRQHLSRAGATPLPWALENRG